MHLSDYIASAALLISVGAAWWARSQSADTRRLREIEDRRHHAERAPQYRLEIEPVNDGQWHRLWVVLESSEALDSLAIEILEPQLIWFPSGQAGIAPGPDTKIANWGAVPMGTRDVALKIDNECDDEIVVRLKLTGSNGGHRWESQHQVVYPEKGYDISKSVY